MGAKKNEATHLQVSKIRGISSKKLFQQIFFTILTHAY